MKKSSDTSKKSKPNVYLIGLSGTGKTRSGQIVSELLGWPFVEMDGVIEDRTGKPIADIFSENGEPYFRELESRLLKEVAGRGGRIVSTGGGVPVRESNRKIMKSSGLIVRLTASPYIIHERLAISAANRSKVVRPLLGNDAPMQKIENMLVEREKAYSIADVTIDTENKTHEEVAELIAETWRSSEIGRSNALH